MHNDIQKALPFSRVVERRGLRKRGGVKIHPFHLPWIRACLYTVYPVRSSQSGRGPQFAADLKRSTRLRCARIMLQGYNQSILISEKTFRSFLWKRLSHDTGMLWIAVGVTFPPETARRRHGTLLHYKTTAILFAVAPLPVLPSPTRHSYIWSVFNFCFSLIRKSKHDFHFGFHHHWYCFPQFRYTWIALSSLNF